MTGHRRARPRFSFWLKVLATGALVLMADQFFFAHGLGSTSGVFALAWLGLTVALRPAILLDRRSALAAAAAALLAALLLDRFTLTGWMLFWTAATTATISPRAGLIPDAAAWAKRLAFHALGGFATPIHDFGQVKRSCPRQGLLRAALLGAILPVGGGLLFLGLFARANPLIASALAAIRLPDLTFVFYLRVMFWMLVGVTVWGGLRPAKRPMGWRKAVRRHPAGPWLFGVSIGSAIAALALFNALFALENGLDLIFLWSGAPLPAGVTLADYAHRGAYPLVLTALLAGGFSLLLLREGSPTAARPLVRWLVGALVAQNVLLTASSILRTVDYVEAYSLTQLRLAALLWMGLVMLGLALIGWRMLRRKRASWLINANVLALAIVLLSVSIGDLGGVAAWWNVRHARDLGGRGAELDVCYLQRLGPSALLPLLDVEQRAGDPALRKRAALAREDVLATLAARQSDWRRWTWRGARRLASTKATMAALHERFELQTNTSCDGSVAPAAQGVALTQPVIEGLQPSAPLTPGARP